MSKCPECKSPLVKVWLLEDPPTDHMTSMMVCTGCGWEEEPKEKEAPRAAAS